MLTISIENPLAFKFILSIPKPLAVVKLSPDEGYDTDAGGLIQLVGSSMKHSHLGQ